MDTDTFRQSLSASEPPPGIGAALEALWHDGKEDSGAAHDRLQDADDPTSAWVHAYLHRKEGDLSNAGYWYRRAGKPVATGPLEDEWQTMTEALLAGAE